MGVATSDTAHQTARLQLQRRMQEKAETACQGRFFSNTNFVPYTLATQRKIRTLCGTTEDITYWTRSDDDKNYPFSSVAIRICSNSWKSQTSASEIVLVFQGISIWGRRCSSRFATISYILRSIIAMLYLYCFIYRPFLSPLIFIWKELANKPCLLTLIKMRF